MKSGVYISYGNHDYELALQISRDLLLSGYAVLMDRLLDDPPRVVESEDAQHLYALADAAIIIFSKHYDIAPYCRSELQQLSEQNVPLYVLTTDPLYTLPQRHNQKMQLDASAWREAQVYQSLLAQLRSGISSTAIHLSDEQRYLLDQRVTIEHQQMATLTGRLRRHRDQHETVRPLCYAPDAWLQAGDDYPIETDGEVTAVNDLAAWLGTHTRLLITGDRATGKSSLLRSITRHLIDVRRRDRHRPFPLPVNLDGWDGRTTFDEFLNSLWPSDSDLNTLLQRAGVIVLIDDVDALPTSDNRYHALLEWLRADANRPVIMTVSYPDPFGGILPVLRLNTIGERQRRKMAEAVTPDRMLVHALTAQPDRTLDEYVHTMLDVVLREHPQVAALDAVLERALAHYWKLTRFGSVKYHTLDTVTERLLQLAVHLIDVRQPDTFSYPLALEALGDQLTLQQLLQLGVLRHRGQGLCFASPALQQHVTLRGLLKEGVYTRLSYPRFDDAGLWQASGWDALILYLPDYFEAPTRAELVRLIWDVDAYLALQMILAEPEPDHRLLSDLLLRMLNDDRDDFWSTNAVSTIMKRFANVDGLSALFYGLFQALEPPALDRLIALIQDGYRAARGLRARLLEQDFEFPEQFFEVVREYPVEILTLGIVCLFSDAKSAVRRSAVRAVAFLDTAVSKPLLVWLLQQPDPVLHQSALDSLVHTTPPDHHAILLTAALRVEDEERAMALYDHIVEAERRLSWQLLRLFDEAGILSRAHIDLVAGLDELTVMAASIQQIETFSYGASSVTLVKDTGNGMVNQLLDALEKHMATFADFSSFDAFVNDVVSTLNRTQRQKSRQIEKLKERLQAMSHRQPSTQPDRDLPPELIQRLRHDDWIIRRNAVHQLKEYEPSKTIPYLLNALHDGDQGVQIAALQTLPDPARYSDVRAALLNMLDDSDDYHVLDAATARLREVSPMIEDHLRRKLEQPISIQTLAAVLDLLDSAESDASSDAVAAYLEDKRQPWLGERKLGEIAQDSLTAMGTPHALNLLAQAGKSPSATRATQAPLQTGDDDAPLNHLSTLLAEIRGDDWDQSQAAAKELRHYAANLAHHHTKRDLDILMGGIDDSNWVVRWAVTEALAWLKNPQSVPPIVRRIEDENWVVRIAALRALIEMRATQAVAAVATCLNDPQSAVREAAAEAIGALGAADDAGYLETAIRDDDDFVRLAAARALIALGGKTALKMLLTLRHDSYAHLRWYVAQYLTGLKHARLLKIYASMLKDTTRPGWEKQSISMMAEAALRAINTADSHAVLARWEEVKDRYR